MSNSQKSDDRLRKMRAGSNLVEVVNQTAPNADPLSSFETLDVQGTRNHFGEEQIQDCKFIALKKQTLNNIFHSVSNSRGTQFAASFEK